MLYGRSRATSPLASARANSHFLQSAVSTGFFSGKQLEKIISTCFKCFSFKRHAIYACQSHERWRFSVCFRSIGKGLHRPWRNSLLSLAEVSPLPFAKNLFCCCCCEKTQRRNVPQSTVSVNVFAAVVFSEAVGNLWEHYRVRTQRSAISWTGRATHVSSRSEGWLKKKPATKRLNACVYTHEQLFAPSGCPVGKMAHIPIQWPDLCTPTDVLMVDVKNECVVPCLAGRALYIFWTAFLISLCFQIPPPVSSWHTLPLGQNKTSWYTGTNCSSLEATNILKCKMAEFCVKIRVKNITCA